MVSTGKLLLKGSVLRLMHMGSAMLIGFFMLPFLINHLGTNQYGLWILIGSILSLFTLLDAGLIGVTQRFIVRAIHSGDDNKVNLCISTSFFLFIGIGLVIAIVTLIVIFIGPYFFDQPDNIPLFQKTIAILGFGTAINIPLATFYGIITAKNRFDLLTYINIFSLALRTTLVIYFISRGSDISILAIITISMLTTEKIAAIILAKNFFEPLHISPSLFRVNLIKEYFNYSKWVYLTTIADRIRFTIDDLVVASIIGLSAVTHYTIAATLILYFGEIIASLFGVVGPSLNKYHKQNNWDELRRTFFALNELVTIVSCLIGGFLITLGPVFINTWIGKGYDDSYHVLVILSISAIIGGTQWASIAVLYASAKHKYYSILTSIEAACNLGLSIILGSYYGVYGIALGTMIPALITKLYFHPKYACKELNIQYSHYMRGMFIKILFSSIYFFTMFLLLQNVLEDNYFSLILYGFIITLGYIMFSLKLLLSKDTKAYLSLILSDKIIGTLKLFRIL